MLQAATIKADASAPAASTKDKDAANSLEANFSSYFSQMMAALPPPLPSALAAPSPPPPAAPAPAASRSAGGAKPAAQSNQSSSQDILAAAGAGALTAAGVAGAGGAANASSGSAPASDQGANAQGGNAAPSQPAGGAQKADPAKASTPPPGGSGDGAGSSDAKPASSAPTDGTGQPPANPAPGPADNGAQLASAAPAQGQSAAQASSALEQAHPGEQFQFQYGEAAPQATTKPPLSEFMNQIQMAPNPGDLTLTSSAPSDGVAPLPAAAGAGAAAASSAQVPPLVEQTALLAVPLAAHLETPSAGTTLSGNVASVQAVGAGAMVGASGSVRVTATTASEPAALPSRQQNLLSQVDGTIRWLVKNQDQSAELQLHPESLGRVQIKIKVEGTVVHAKIWASEPSAVPVMQDHRAFLESSLKSQGLTLGSFDLQQGRRQDQAPLPTPSEPSPASTRQERPEAVQESPPPAPAGPSRAYRVEYVA